MDSENSLRSGLRGYLIKQRDNLFPLSLLLTRTHQNKIIRVSLIVINFKNHGNYQQNNTKDRGKKKQRDNLFLILWLMEN